MEEQISICKWVKLSLVASFFIIITTNTYANTSVAQPKFIQLAANSFVYNPKTLTWHALKDGKVVRSGRGSGGKGYCKDIRRSCRTPSGTYRVVSKGGPGCKSSRYPVGRGGAPMPYCMFFSKYYAIHGSPDVPNYNASHGCVRVHPSDARWLNHEFLNVGSKVTIKSY